MKCIFNFTSLLVFVLFLSSCSKMQDCFRTELIYVRYIPDFEYKFPFDEVDSIVKPLLIKYFNCSNILHIRLDIDECAKLNSTYNQFGDLFTVKYILYEVISDTLYDIGNSFFNNFGGYVIEKAGVYGFYMQSVENVYFTIRVEDISHISEGYIQIRPFHGPIDVENCMMCKNEYIDLITKGILFKISDGKFEIGPGLHISHIDQARFRRKF